MGLLNRSCLVAAALGVGVLGAAEAGADTLTAQSFNSSGAGIVTPNGDGSLHLHTVSGADKASVTFFNGSQLGTLGSLTGFGAEFMKESGSFVKNTMAIRLLTNTGGTEGLVWENNYNGNGDVPLNTWLTPDLFGGNFWQRGNGGNFNGASQAVTLTNWKSGTVSYTVDGTGAARNSVPMNGSTPIYGVEVSYGSGAGAFEGDVRNVTLSFAGGANFIGAESPVTPLPSAAVGGLACLGLFAMGRRRRAVVA
jgi:hypothetical protein